MSEKVRQQLRFTGRVQGVGFRYTAQYTAQHFGLTGWVFNDYDGTVLMEIQGNPESIKKMIDRLDSDRFIRIEGIEKTEIPVVEHEISFYVR
jgi:acylphosphatase